MRLFRFQFVPPVDTGGLQVRTKMMMMIYNGGDGDGDNDGFNDNYDDNDKMICKQRSVIMHF